MASTKHLWIDCETQLNFLNFSNLSLPSCPTWVMVGNADAFAEAHRVAAWAEVHSSLGNPVHVEVCRQSIIFIEAVSRKCGGVWDSFWIPSRDRSKNRESRH